MKKILIGLSIFFINCYAITNLENTLSKKNKYTFKSQLDLSNRLTKTHNYNDKLKIKLPKEKNRLKLVVKANKDESKKFVKNHRIENNDYINFAIEYNNSFLNTISIKTKIGINLNNQIDSFAKLSATKTWRNFYGVDYTFGQSIKDSIINTLEYKSYFKLDTKLNETYSLHNCYESYWQNEKENNTELNSSIYLDQRVSEDSNLLYKIGLISNDSDSNIQINIKYKILL
jgi:hypothetical protein